MKHSPRIERESRIFGCPEIARQIDHTVSRSFQRRGAAQPVRTLHDALMTIACAELIWKSQQREAIAASRDESSLSRLRLAAVVSYTCALLFSVLPSPRLRLTVTVPPPHARLAAAPDAAEEEERQQLRQAASQAATRLRQPTSLEESVRSCDPSSCARAASSCWSCRRLAFSDLSSCGCRRALLTRTSMLVLGGQQKQPPSRHTLLSSPASRTCSTSPPPHTPRASRPRAHVARWEPPAAARNVSACSINSPPEEPHVHQISVSLQPRPHPRRPPPPQLVPPDPARCCSGTSPPNGLPRFSAIITAAHLLPLTALPSMLWQALSSLREPSVDRSLPLRTAWSSLYSDALLSCFEYLELRDLKRVSRVVANGGTASAPVGCFA
jgi:hypothetical protein